MCAFYTADEIRYLEAKAAETSRMLSQELYGDDAKPITPMYSGYDVVYECADGKKRTAEERQKWQDEIWSHLRQISGT